MRTVAIVGSSLAGLRAAETFRREGFDGRIVAIGAEAHLPYDRPPLSKEFLRGDWEPEQLVLRKQGVDDLDPKHLSEAVQYRTFDRNMWV